MFHCRTQSKSIERLKFDWVRLPNVRLVASGHNNLCYLTSVGSRTFFSHMINKQGQGQTSKFTCAESNANLPKILTNCTRLKACAILVEFSNNTSTVNEWKHLPAGTNSPEQIFLNAPTCAWLWYSREISWQRSLDLRAGEKDGLKKNEITALRICREEKLVLFNLKEKQQYLITRKSYNKRPYDKEKQEARFISIIYVCIPSKVPAVQSKCRTFIFITASLYLHMQQMHRLWLKCCHAFRGGTSSL